MPDTSVPDKVPTKATNGSAPEEDAEKNGGKAAEGKRVSIQPVPQFRKRGPTIKKIQVTKTTLVTAYKLRPPFLLLPQVRLLSFRIPIDSLK